MIFASSKDALRRRLEGESRSNHVFLAYDVVDTILIPGIQIEIQATDFSEITKDASEFSRRALIGIVQEP